MSFLPQTKHYTYRQIFVLQGNITLYGSDVADCLTQIAYVGKEVDAVAPRWHTNHLKITSAVGLGSEQLKSADSHQFRILLLKMTFEIRGAVVLLKGYFRIVFVTSKLYAAKSLFPLSVHGVYYTTLVVSCPYA